MADRRHRPPAVAGETACLNRRSRRRPHAGAQTRI